MVKAVVVEQHGGPEVLQIKEVDIKKPGSGEVLIKQTAIGLNFMDIRQRAGSFPVESPPFVVGSEACGVVEEVGSDVPEFRKGDRVAYATTITGAYTEARVINHNYLVPVPDYISDEVAASLMLKGMTAFYLLRRTFFISEKHTILVHAAAGGVGQLLCKLAKHFGGNVIATVGSEEKKPIVRSLGIDKVINYNKNFVKLVEKYTDGKGVHVVYDSIGKDTFNRSLNCLAEFGLMVNYGWSSGEAQPLQLSKLLKKSLFVTRPSLFTYTQFREELLLNSNEVFTLAQQKVITPNIFKKYKLSEVAEAHEDLENKKTTGQSIISIKT
jgi:NADPH:quinone reductase